MKRLFLLILTLTLITGCGGRVIRLADIPFKGNSAYAISGTLKEIDSKHGTFTAQLDITEVWYEGVTKAYRSPGGLLGRTRYFTRPKINQKQRMHPIHDVQDDINIKVIENQGGSKKNIPFKTKILSDNLMKFIIDSGVLSSLSSDIHVHISLNSDGIVNTLTKDEGNVQRRVNTSIELSPTGPVKRLMYEVDN